VLDRPEKQQMPKTPNLTRYSSLSLTDLICLCAGPCDNEAWQEFVFRVGKPIGLVVMRTASMWGNTSRSLVEDLIQAIYLKLWEGGRSLLREFAVHRPDAILGYLKKTAANTAVVRVSRLAVERPVMKPDMPPPPMPSAPPSLFCSRMTPTREIATRM